MNSEKITVINFLGIIMAVIPFIVSPCAGGDGKLRHGDLSYKVKDIFSENPDALALAEAAGRGDVREIERLVAAGKKVNGVGKHEITPLWWAAWVENYDGFSALLEKNADPNLFRSEGLPVMHLVAQIDDARFLGTALKHRGNPDTLDIVSGETPLFLTVLFDRKEQTEMLLHAGANLNAQQAVSGRTLPMVAIGSNGNYKLVYELLQMGADYNLKTSKGKTLVDTITLRSIDPNDDRYIWREKVIAYLRSKGLKVDRPAHETPRK